MFVIIRRNITNFYNSNRDSFWPNGVSAEPQPQRDHSTMMRTRVVAKAKMLGSVSGRLNVPYISALFTHLLYFIQCERIRKFYVHLFSEDLKTFLGSETLRLGVFRVFNMFQHQRLNKRLVYVILEGMLETLFTDNKFPEVFRKLHSRSQRVKKDGAKFEKVPLTRMKGR